MVIFKAVLCLKLARFLVGVGAGHYWQPNMLRESSWSPGPERRQENSGMSNTVIWYGIPSHTLRAVKLPQKSGIWN